MNASVPSPRLLYLCSLVLTVLALAAFWYQLGRPQLPAEPAVPAKLQCVSYSPFAKDQSPLTPGFVLRPERMDADLALLSRRFECLRVYSMLGMQALPSLARKHGLKLILGAWVDRDAAATEREIDSLIATANAHPDVVTAVVVGNETLLRQEVSSAELVRLIRRVKQQVRQPVTYADVWEFWLKHPEVAPAVDFLTIHLLPYWEDQPAGIDQALGQVERVRRLFGERFAPKEILIGEAGWPSAGRQRQTAVPGPLNQARFIRGFVELAERNGWRYNLIEAFDQPWKREREGTVGGYWGLFDADRQDKGILAGALSNLPRWPLWLAFGLGTLAATLLLAGLPSGRRNAWLLPPLAALGAACLGLWGEMALGASRHAGEWLWAALLAGLNLLVLAHAALLLGSRSPRHARLLAWLEAKGGWWLSASAFAAAVSMLALVFDARYRGFPSAALLLPALVYLCHPVRGPRRELALLACLIGAGVLPQLYQEGLDNRQALAWALVSGLLVLALWRSLRLGRSRCLQPDAEQAPMDAGALMPATSSRAS